MTGIEVWSHHNPVRVHLADLTMLSQFASDGRTLVVTSPGAVRRGSAALLEAILRPRSVTVFSTVTPNPDVLDLHRAAETLQGGRWSSVIGVGGGSVLDTAKVLACLLHPGVGGVSVDLLRQGASREWNERLPLILAPTTAGTGAEVTPFATMWDAQMKRKYSLVGHACFADVALLDPRLSLSLDAETTLYSGLDAVSHSLESLWNANRTPASIACAVEALKHLAEALPSVLEHPSDIGARQQMLVGSYLAGMAIAQTRTALAHAMSYPLTLRFGVPHGLACSFTLPALIDANFDWLASLARDRELVARVFALLSALQLPNRVRQFATGADVIACAPEMYHPERAGNYGGVALSGVEGVLRHAFATC